MRSLVLRWWVLEFALNFTLCSSSAEFLTSIFSVGSVGSTVAGGVPGFLRVVCLERKALVCTGDAALERTCGSDWIVAWASYV